MELPPPSPEEVAGVLERALAQLLADFESRGVAWPEDEYEALQAKSAQLRLPLDEEPSPARRGRLAVMMGFSLHADTGTSANDRQGLLRLVRYGARGPIAESRLSRREDGRYAYETKRGVTLVLTAQQLVKRLIALIVPKGRCNNVAQSMRGRFVFFSRGAGIERGDSVLGGGCTSVERAAAAGARTPWKLVRWRPFACDVWRCPCGGQRRVVALVTNRRAAEEMLRNMGMLDVAAPLPQAPGPPQLELAQ